MTGELLDRARQGMDAPALPGAVEAEPHMVGSDIEQLDELLQLAGSIVGAGPHADPAEDNLHVLADCLYSSEGDDPPQADGAVAGGADACSAAKQDPALVGIKVPVASAQEAKAAWSARRAHKREARARKGKVTYGELIRTGYEQFLPRAGVPT